MRQSLRYRILLFAAGAMLFGFVGSSGAEDLTIKNCAELVRLAGTCQEDLKTVDTVLGSAIEAGNIDRIRNYRLRKAEIKKRLKSLMRVIDLKECVFSH